MRTQTTILRRLLRAPQSAMHIPTEQLSTVVAPVKPRTQKSEEKVVVMTEVPETCEEHALSECMEMCDIACRRRVRVRSQAWCSTQAAPSRSST